MFMHETKTNLLFSCPFFQIMVSSKVVARIWLKFRVVLAILMAYEPHVGMCMCNAQLSTSYM